MHEMRSRINSCKEKDVKQVNIEVHILWDANLNKTLHLMKMPVYFKIIFKRTQAI